MFEFSFVFSWYFRESIAQHVLTVMVKDAGTPAKRNYARVVIDVFDANDHAPEFSMSIMQGRVFETAAVGTTVVQVLAMDKDHGENAAITYHIASGKRGSFPALCIHLREDSIHFSFFVFAFYVQGI